MNDTVNRSLDESLLVSSSTNVVRITWLVETQKWTQMNLDMVAARQLVAKLQRAIEAAEFLAKLEAEGK